MEAIIQEGVQRQFLPTEKAVKGEIAAFAQPAGQAPEQEKDFDDPRSAEIRGAKRSIDPVRQRRHDGMVTFRYIVMGKELIYQHNRNSAYLWETPATGISAPDSAAT
jgi:hypothetical protein